MVERQRYLSVDTVPDILPIFPLPGALLLPGGRLPLNIFEPRYLNMVEDALGSGRMIGMIQPFDEHDERQIADGTAIYDVGCVGRIVEFAETDDGRFLISLDGMVRFRVAEELSMIDGYRRVRPQFHEFELDFSNADSGFEPIADRSSFLTAMNDYFGAKGISADIDAIENAPDDALITSLAMSCPFDPREKQALLECPDTASRGELLRDMFLFATHEGSREAPVVRQ